MKNYKLAILFSISAFLVGCSEQTPVLMPIEPTVPVQAAAKKTTPEKGKIIARKKNPKKILRNSGSSYSAKLRFEYTGSLFTPASQDVSEFMERYSSDLDDWELEELDNDTFDQLGKRRYNLTVYGPDRARLDYILGQYREHLKSLG